MTLLVALWFLSRIKIRLSPIITDNWDEPERDFSYANDN